MAGGALVDLHCLESHRSFGDVGVENLGFVLIRHCGAGNNGYHPSFDQLLDLGHFLRSDTLVDHRVVDPR